MSPPPVPLPHQDWVYYRHKRQHLTLEVHAQKDVSSGTSLPDYYLLNRASMLRLAEASHLGVKAVVLDAVTGVAVAADVLVMYNGVVVQVLPHMPSCGQDRVGAGVRVGVMFMFRV